MGIPVGVEDDDGVGGLQVKSETTRSRAQYEDEVLRVRGAEQLQKVATIIRLCRSIEAQVLEAWRRKSTKYQ